MVDVTFHIRKEYYFPEAGGAPVTAINYFKDDGTHYTNDFSYSVMEEGFVLYPRISGVVAYTYQPTDLGASLYSMRVNQGIFSFSYPLDYNFGDIGVSAPSTFTLRHGTSGLEESSIHITDTEWATANWTTATFNTFKTEVTGFLASAIVTSRNFTGSDRMPQSVFSDWSVQFLMNQLDGTIHFIIFYPGNDPLADEIIVESV